MHYSLSSPNLMACFPEFLIAETIAPANLYTGKADDEDSGAEDEVQLQVIRVRPFHGTGS
jgi:hypothetical protein